MVLREWHQVQTKILNSCQDCGYCGTADGHYADDSEPVYCRITYVFSGDPRFGGIEPGYVVLALAPAMEEKDHAATQP